MYLPPDVLSRLIRDLARQFTGATLLFDAYRFPARQLLRFHDTLPQLPDEPLRSTFPRSPYLRIEESLALRDVPGVRGRLPRLHRLPAVGRLYSLNRATLIDPGISLPIVQG